MESITQSIVPITMDIVRVIPTKGDLDSIKPWEWQLEYKITIRYKDRVIWSGPFYTGVGWIKNFPNSLSMAQYDELISLMCNTKSRPYFGEKINHGFKIKEPTIDDVMGCLVDDARAIDYESFEDWASEYDYDEDSRKAEKIYNECLKTGLALRAVFGDKILTELQEKLQ